MDVENIVMNEISMIARKSGNQVIKRVWWWLKVKCDSADRAFMLLRHTH
jgi:hypothetical protein